MNDHQYRLVVDKGPEPGKIYELTSVSMTIGRDPMAEITINDLEVSRKHARLIGTLSGYRIQDLGSTNGTFIDGNRLGGEPRDLIIGQIVSIGSGVVLVYQDLSDYGIQSVTMLDGAQVSQDMLESEEEPQRIVDEADGNPTGEFTNDDFESKDDGSLSEQKGDQSTRVDQVSPDASWDSSSQAETSTSYQGDPISYEAEPVSEAVVIPHRGESGQSVTGNNGSNSRRLSSIIAALVLLVICCCCSFILFLYYYGGDWLLRQIGWLS